MNSELTCFQLLPEEVIYFVYTWFSLVTVAAIGVLLFTSLEALKKHRAIEERTSYYSGEEDSYYSEDSGEAWEDHYEVMPEEYRPKRQSKERESSLGPISEDGEEESEEDEDKDEDDENNENDYAESDNSDNNSLRIKYKSSLSAESTASKTSRESSRSHSSAENKQSRSQKSKSNLKVPRTDEADRGGNKSIGGNLQRSESQNRADFLLRLMSRPEDYQEYQPPPLIEKFSPTGRKISTDVGPQYMNLPPRNRESIGGRRAVMEGTALRKVSVGLESRQSSSHLYVNLPPRSASSGEIYTVSEETGL